MNDFINITNTAILQHEEAERKEAEREARHEAAMQEGYKNMRQGQKMRELRCKAHKWDITEKALTVCAGCLMMLVFIALIALAQII